MSLFFVSLKMQLFSKLFKIVISISAFADFTATPAFDFIVNEFF